MLALVAAAAMTDVDVGGVYAGVGVSVVAGAGGV